jgi:NADPH-dependent glutamate synthase beta subunit-like oxidoreductase
MPWNHWMFKGTYQPRYWSETEHFEEVGKVYGFAGASKEVDGKFVEAGEFVRAKIGAKIRPTSCYLEWVEPQTNNARALTRGAAAKDEELPQSITVKLVSASGETTSIGEIDTKTGEISLDGWYTMDGVKLSGKPNKSGLYINNGRKVVIEF